MVYTPVSNWGSLRGALFDLTDEMVNSWKLIVNYIPCVYLVPCYSVMSTTLKLLLRCLHKKTLVENIELFSSLLNFYAEIAGCRDRNVEISEQNVWK